MQNKRQISDSIEDLIEVWRLWMKFHKLANDHSLKNSERRGYGMMCEKLLSNRQELIREIDEIVEREWISENKG